MDFNVWSTAKGHIRTNHSQIYFLFLHQFNTQVAKSQICLLHCYNVKTKVCLSSHHSYSSFVFFFDSTSLSLVHTKLVSPYLGKAQQPREQRYPFLPACVVFSCVRTMVWLPVFGIFNVHTDVDACDCTRELYGHRKRVCTGSYLWEKNPLPHRGLEPASVSCWLFSRTFYPLSYSRPNWQFHIKTQQNTRKQAARTLLMNE